LILNDFSSQLGRRSIEKKMNVANAKGMLK